MASEEELQNARELEDVDVREVSLVDKGAIRRPFSITKRGAPCEDEVNKGGAKSLAVADLSTPWNPVDANQRVRDWADAKEGPNPQYAQAFLWKSENSEEFDGYKMQFADVVDGELTVIPAAVTKIAAVLQAASLGGTVGDEQTELRNAVERIYAEFRKAFDAPDLRAPWEIDDMANDTTKTEETETNKADDAEGEEVETQPEGDASAEESATEETEESGEEEEEDDAKGETTTEDSKKSEPEPAAVAALMGAIGVAMPALENAAKNAEDEESREAFGTLASFLGSVQANNGSSEISEKSEGVQKARRMTENRKARLIAARDEIDGLLKEFAPAEQNNEDGEEVETTKGAEAPAAEPLDVNAIAKAVASEVTKSVKTDLEERFSKIEKALDMEAHAIPAPNGQGSEGVTKRDEEEEVQKSTSELFSGIF